MVTTTVRIVPFDEHADLLSIQDGLDAIREGYRDWADNQSRLVTEPRHRVISQETGVRMDVHFGLSPRVGGGGVRLNSHQPASDTQTQEYGEEGLTTYAVYDTESARCLGFILGRISVADYVGRFSTALETIVGTDALARNDATTVGLLGSGRQARSHLITLAAVRDLEAVRIYSPTPAHRESFAAQMGDTLDIDIRPVETTEAAIAGADIVLCATDASSPVFDGDLLESGQHVTSIVGSDIELVEAGLAPERRREIDDTTVERADVFVVNSVAQARQNEQGDIYLPATRGIIEWNDIVDIAEVVGGNHPGRDRDDQITVYKQNGGQGVTQNALASRLWEAIENADCGSEISTAMSDSIDMYE